MTKDLRAYSIHEAFFFLFFLENGERQKENSKPSNLGGVKSDLNYSGRTRARGSKSGSGFRLQKAGEGKKDIKPKPKSSLTQIAFTMRITKPDVFSFTNTVKMCTSGSLCFLLSELVGFLWLVLYELKTWNLVASFTRGVKACLKDFIVSLACTAWCRIYATNTLLHKVVQLCK